MPNSLPMIEAANYLHRKNSTCATYPERNPRRHKLMKHKLTSNNAL